MKDPIMGLETLLDLNGEVYFMDNGYWIKIEAREGSVSKHVPHGIRYSLTLHDRNNTRVLGYDNAHAMIKSKRKRFSGNKVTWDHIHKRDMNEPYEFDTAAQLLEDFWNDVDKCTK